MATKIELLSHGDKVLSPITKASNVLFENGKTAQDILNDKQDENFTPKITSSSSMFKVGQGDNADYSSNVANGAYESIVLKGKSMVNCIQEPSSQDVVLPYEFEDGQYVTINDTKESGALGVELKGQTLVNLATKTWAMGSTAQFNKDTTTLTTDTDKTWFSTTLKTVGMKAGGTYLLYTDSITYDTSLSSSPNLVSLVSLYEMKPNRNVGKFISNGAVKVTIPSDVDASDIGIRIHTTLEEGTGGVGKTTTVKGLMILEYQDGMENWDIPYFEGMTSCKMPTLHTVGKNLLPSIKNTWYPCRFKQGTTFKLSTRDSVPSNGGNVVFKDINGASVWFGIDSGNTTSTKVLPCDVYYIMNSLATGVEHQLEIGTQVTSYEPNKTSILSLPEEVVLRSLPNRVCDTFNTRTGEYVQRIGERILDGSESQWIHGSISPTNVFELPMTNMKRYTGVGQIICNTLPYSYTNLEVWDTYTGVSPLSARENIVLRNNNTDTIQDLKAWLSQNPTTICYELETPIVTKINLPSTLKSWNTTTHIYSEIPENTLYPTLSHSNPSYPVILKPSTKYSIVANSYSNNHTNSAIKFNLGGATASTTVGSRVTAITTPSTLSNELLTMSGRGNKLNNVMVIEGDVAGDESYFEGICDCKSPILTNLDANNEQLNTTTFDQKDDKTIVLRSLPNGVCDTLDVETGEYVSYVEQVVLTGSESENWNLYHDESSAVNPRSFYVTLAQGEIAGSNQRLFLNDKYPIMKSTTQECAWYFDTNGHKIAFTDINKQFADVSEWRNYLETNSITLFYPRLAPIVSTVDVQGFPYAYQNGHVQLSSGSIEQSLAPIIEYSLPTNRNGQIRSNQKMVEKHQKELDKLQAIVLANLVNSQYNQTLTTLKYELSRV